MDDVQSTSSGSTVCATPSSSFRSSPPESRNSGSQSGSEAQPSGPSWLPAAPRAFLQAAKDFSNSYNELWDCVSNIRSEARSRDAMRREEIKRLTSQLDEMHRTNEILQKANLATLQANTNLGIENKSLWAWRWEHERQPLQQHSRGQGSETQPSNGATMTSSPKAPFANMDLPGSGTTSCDPSPWASQSSAQMLPSTPMTPSSTAWNYLQPEPQLTEFDPFRHNDQDLFGVIDFQSSSQGSQCGDQANLDIFSGDGAIGSGTQAESFSQY